MKNSALEDEVEVEADESLVLICQSRVFWSHCEPRISSSLR